MTLHSAASRLWFGWMLAWNAVVLASLWPAWMVTLRIRPTAAAFSVWARIWSRVVLTGCGVRVVRQGTVPAGPAVLVANHQAMLDIPALAVGVDAPFVFVARSDLRRMPLIGSLLHRSRCVFLDRSDPATGLAEVAARLSAGDTVLMFPEGTRSFGSATRGFRSGAFRLAAAAGAPIVPVAIDGAYRVLDERAKTARPGRVTVSVLPPLSPVPGERALATGARARLAIDTHLRELREAAVPRSEVDRA